MSSCQVGLVYYWGNFPFGWMPCQFNGVQRFLAARQGAFAGQSTDFFFFAGFAWTLWTTRDKMAIEKHFPKAPTDVIYDALSLMQKWSIMLKEGERKRFI
jgi:hypothetical protein